MLDGWKGGMLERWNLGGNLGDELAEKKDN
jgi:hypothetical protein